MSYRPEEAPDPLAARYLAAAPEVSVDAHTVLRAGRRRRTVRRVGVAVVTVLGVTGVSLAATALPLERPTQIASQSPTESETADSSAALTPQEQLLALADEVEAAATPVPEGQAFHFVSTDWLSTDGGVQMVGLERTSNPDGTIYQVESQTEPRDDLSVGDPLPDDAQVTEVGPMDQGRPDWAFEADLPRDPAALRAAWLDSCGVDPSLGAAEYRCVYVGMQETIPIATDEMAASVLRLLVDEPGVAIEKITDQLGRDRIAATFDLPDEGTVSYLIDPGTGRVDGMQREDEHQMTVSRLTMEWIDPVTGF